MLFSLHAEKADLYSQGSSYRSSPASNSIEDKSDFIAWQKNIQNVPEENKKNGKIIKSMGEKEGGESFYEGENLVAGLLERQKNGSQKKQNF